MDYVIVGGDARFMWLARLLKRRGAEVATVFQSDEPGDTALIRDAKSIVVNAPPGSCPGEITLEGLLDMRREGTVVYACGPEHPPQAEGIVDLWSDEALIARNARLTAEGAVIAAARAADCALDDMRGLVVGWGRIGRALTEILVALGARVTVVSRSEANRNRAVERGAEAAATEDLAEALQGHRLIFNTAPSMLLDASTLCGAERDALLVDLASPPYGIDLRAAWEQGLRAWREPRLPGRYCPESAARALLEAIKRHERGGAERE